MNIYFIAGCSYLSGMIVLAAIKIVTIRNTYPEEASQMKILRTYWVKEWAAFLLSTVFLVMYLFMLTNFLGRTIYNVQVRDFVQVISAMVGLGSQAIATELFGVTKKLARKLSTEKIQETAKQEGSDQMLEKMVTIQKIKQDQQNG